MRDRQQVNIGDDQSSSEDEPGRLHQSASLRLFTLKSCPRRDSTQCPQPSWGHWKGPAMLGLAVFDIIEKM